MAFTPSVKGSILDRQIEPGDYIYVAAGQTAQILGTAGGASKNNFLTRLIIIPATVGAGSVSLIDGASPATPVTIPIFDTGTLADLKPIVIEIGAFSQVGAWYITT